MLMAVVKNGRCSEISLYPVIPSHLASVIAKLHEIGPQVVEDGPNRLRIIQRQISPEDGLLDRFLGDLNTPTRRLLAHTAPDTGNTFTYSLIAGTGDTDNSAFSIVGNQLQINNSPDFETKNSYSIRVKTTDQGGLSFEKTLTIAVNDVNENPSNQAPTNLALSATTVNENVAPNTVIGTFSSTDPDSGNSFTYSLVTGTGDTDNSAFSIVGNQLQEISYIISIYHYGFI